MDARSHRRWVAVLSIAALVCASSACAQEALWQAPPEARAAPWFAGVRSALEGENAVVRPGASDAACATADCGLRAARELGLSRAMRVHVEPESGAEPRRVRLALFDANGAHSEVTTSVTRGDVATAARDAYRDAELALGLGGQALLRVRTTPAGALVSIDGRPAGLAPLERKLAPGAHRVGLELDGFASATRRVDLVSGRAFELELQLVQAQPPADRAAAPRAGDRASALNWILGGVLIASSAPMLGSAFATLANEGDCARRNALGACTGRVHFGTQSALLLGFGTAALAGGVTILALAPFRIAAELEPRSARVTTQLRF